MSKNYSPELPLGKMGEIKTNYPPAKAALVSTTRENASISSVTALGHDTTEIEVTAIGQTAAIRWAANQASSLVTAAGSANFDNTIPSGEFRRFVIPITTSGQSSGSVQGVNRREGLFQNIATRTLAGNGSVLLGEF